MLRDERTIVAVLLQAHVKSNDSEQIENPIYIRFYMYYEGTEQFIVKPLSKRFKKTTEWNRVELKKL